MAPAIIAKAQDYPKKDFDLVTFFDCLHDMGDPAGAAKHVRQSFKPDGTWMIVEPYANEKTEDNLNPVGRIYYSASTMICTPASKAQEVGPSTRRTGQRFTTERSCHVRRLQNIPKSY